MKHERIVIENNRGEFETVEVCNCEPQPHNTFWTGVFLGAIIGSLITYLIL